MNVVSQSIVADDNHDLDVSVLFRKRIDEAFKKSGFKSKRQASLNAGMSPPQVGAIIRGEYDQSTSGPGIFAGYRLAKTLGVTVESLLEPHAAYQPKDKSEFNMIKREEVCVDLIVEEWERGAHKLQALNRLADHFDLYFAPQDDDITPRIARLGKNTLFAMRIKTTDVEVAQRELRVAEPSQRRGMLDFHRKVMAEQMACDCFFADHKLATQPARVRGLSQRLGLLVEGDRGEKLIVIRCAPIPV